MDERIKRTMSLVLGVPAETIGEDASPATIRTWDSLRHMNLILALEEEFDIRFDDHQVTRLQSLLSLRAAIAAKTS